MTLKLQQEMPADSDLFRGESHKKVAAKMAQVIKEQDINILGLEGELGSGKSTIIHFLKKELSPEHTFINFDAEIYHYGNTKKALIEVIHDGINESQGVNKVRLETLKNKALGNIVEYDKRVSSRLSWWTVSFILLSLLSVQMVRYLLLDLNSYITSGKLISWPVILLELLALLSPGILLLWLKCVRRRQKKALGKTEDIITIGDLFKQNSVDRVSETWLISREIGTIELTNALAGFTESTTVPADAKFILIIDNLDRIGADKVKELWSDMELIAGTTHKQFRIIVPYSARHVAKSLLVEGHTGREFIAKRIPVTFTVPPLVTAGWQDVFRIMWKETVSEQPNFSCAETMQILERWRPGEYPRVTPRLLKKLVNDVHILQMTVPATAPEEYVLLALYVIFVRYNESEVTALLRFSEGEDTTMPPSEYKDKVQKTQVQLNRLYLNNTQRWSEYLMSIHFQASVELARSELFDTPLIDAVKNKDFAELEKLSGLYGFSHAWQRCAPRMSMLDWMETVTKLPPVTIEKVRAEIASSVRTLNASYALKERENFRLDFSTSVRNLKQGNYIGLEIFIERQKDLIIRELNHLQGMPRNNKEYITEILTEAEIYSEIYNSSLLKDDLINLSGVFYSVNLLYEEDKYPHLEICDLELSHYQKENMLRYELSDNSSNIFDKGIIKFFGLGSKIISGIIKNEKQALPGSISNIYDEVIRCIPQGDINYFRKIIFKKEWYSNDFLQRMPYQSEIQSLFPEEFAAHLVAHMVAINNYSTIEIHAKGFLGNAKFDDYLSSYFIYMDSFLTVIKGLNNEIAAPYVRNAISIIFHKNKLESIPTFPYVSEYYSAIKSLPNEVDVLGPMTDREEDLRDEIDDENLERLDAQFIADIFLTHSLPMVMEKIITLSQLCFADETSLYAAFKELGENRKIILSKMVESGRSANSNNFSHLFAGWYRSAEISQLSNSENVRFLWSVLDAEQRTEILRELHDILLEGDRSIERRIAIIRGFNDVLTFNEPEGRTSRRALAELFPLSLDDLVLRNWLDSQNLKLGSWNKDEAETVNHVVSENQELFPRLTETSQYIRKRLQPNVE
ncbi:P-loop NTPase fold protein [Pectobacterium aroidearum]|nr:P-loop NTPase fold protein [Pectobacterium aroidearum]